MKQNTKTEAFVGKSFHELSNSEMEKIVGGNQGEQRIIGQLASGFVISWLASAALKCK